MYNHLIIQVAQNITEQKRYHGQYREIHVTGASYCLLQFCLYKHMAVTPQGDHEKVKRAPLGDVHNNMSREGFKEKMS